MADYSELDEATLQQMLNDATSYEERSLVRQALRQKKKQRGAPVGRSTNKSSTYNRFAGTSTRTTLTPKNFVAKEGSVSNTVTATQSKRTDEIVSEPYQRPRTPTPPPTPTEETDLPPHIEEEAPLSPPPTPESTPPKSPSPAPRSPSPVPRSPSPAPRSPSPVPRSPSPAPRSPSPVPRSPSPAPRSPSPVPRSPSPAPRSPSPVPRSPSPAPRSPSPVLRSPSPAPRSPLPAPRSPSVEDTDTGRDPGLGEEGSIDQDAQEETDNTGGITSPSTGTEFQGFKLRKTNKEPSSKFRGGSQPKVDFGVKLKKATPAKSPPATRTKPLSPKTVTTTGGPRTLRDYQQLGNRSKPSRPLTPEEEGPPMPSDELQKYLVAYVNTELALHPELPVKGRALFETASNPTNLCKLINKSVPNTVDLRALTKIPVRGSADAKREAMEENIMLVVESARAIGCRVNDTSGENILQGDPSTIRQFLVDLIRARVVHMPGMDDEPSSTFTNMSTLFSKLGIKVSSNEMVDGVQDDPDKIREALETPPPKETAPPKAESATLTYEERAALRKAEREKKRSEDQSAVVDKPELSYEERAAQRKAEREKRRREREALAK